MLIGWFEDTHDAYKKKGGCVYCVSYIQGVIYTKINLYFIMKIKIVWKYYKLFEFKLLES